MCTAKTVTMQFMLSFSHLTLQLPSWFHVVFVLFRVDFMLFSCCFLKGGFARGW
jgi:hypothetical protein